MNSKSNDVFDGRSFKMPLTVKLSLSMVITLFIASFVPKIFMAIFSVTTIEFTSSSAVFQFPFTRGKLNMDRNEGSVTIAFDDTFLSAALVTYHLELDLQIFSTSGYSCFNVGPRILGVLFQ